MTADDVVPHVVAVRPKMLGVASSNYIGHHWTISTQTSEIREEEHLTFDDFIFLVIARFQWTKCCRKTSCLSVRGETFELDHREFDLFSLARGTQGLRSAVFVAEAGCSRAAQIC